MSLDSRLDRDSKEKTTMRQQAKILATFTVTALLAAAAPAAFAQPPGGHRGGRGPGHAHGRDLTELLDLTDEQREAWRQARRSHFEAQRPSIERIRELREQLNTELQSDSPDAATVGEYVISIREIDAALDASRGDLDSALREMLTDEQKTRFDEWKAANPGSRRGFGPGGWHDRRHRGHPRGTTGDDPDA
jgi:Spy/CpxP family protein refolding chaperone